MVLKNTLSENNYYNLRYTDMIAPVTKLDATHDQFPDKFMFATEACSGSVPFLEPKVDLGSWERGQYYSKDIINVC